MKLTHCSIGAAALCLTSFVFAPRAFSAELALPRDGWVFGPVHCRLHVLDPIETVGYAPAQAPELRERVRRAIVAQIAEWRGVAPAEVAAARGGVEDGQNRPAGAGVAGGRG